MSSGIGPPIASIAASEDEISDRSRPMLPARTIAAAMPTNRAARPRISTQLVMLQTSIFTVLRIQMTPMM